MMEVNRGINNARRRKEEKRSGVEIKKTETNVILSAEEIMIVWRDNRRCVLFVYPIKGSLLRTGNREHILSASLNYLEIPSQYNLLNDMGMVNNYRYPIQVYSS